SPNRKAGKQQRHARGDRTPAANRNPCQRQNGQERERRPVGKIGNEGTERRETHGRGESNADGAIENGVTMEARAVARRPQHGQASSEARPAPTAHPPPGPPQRVEVPPPRIPGERQAPPPDGGADARPRPGRDQGEGGPPGRRIKRLPAAGPEPRQETADD